ncbi:MAG: glycosyltransferase [Lachnospiraceae bacterium]|nr:glycosyltransferase [Lachnospiraceae bacterium]
MKEFQFHPEVNTLNENGLYMVGWVISQKPLTYRVFDGDKKECPYRVFGFPRSDINEDFGLQEGTLTGFRLQILIPESEIRARLPITVEVSGDGVLSTRFTDEDYKKEYYAKGSGFWPKAHRGMDYLMKNGIRMTLHRLLSEGDSAKGSDEAYLQWLKDHTPTPEELNRQSEEVFSYRPKISLVIPVYRTPESYLREMLDSILSQSYQNMEICLAVASDEDCSDGQTIRIREILDEYKKKLPQLKHQILDCNYGIGENTNRAIGMATGDVVAFMDHDDVLSPDAFYEVVRAFNKTEEIDIVYTDQDKVDEESRSYFDPFFKPDYDPVMLCGLNYMSHFFAVKRSLLSELSYWNSPEFDGAQDYDLIFRLTERAKGIAHVPRPVYHWRAHSASTAESPYAKRYAYDAGKRAIAAHYRRLHIPAEVDFGPEPGTYVTEFLHEDLPESAVLMLSEHDGEDVVSARITQALEAAGEGYLFILHEDIKAKPEDLLPDLFGYALQENVAACMPKVLYADEMEDVTKSAAHFNGLVAKCVPFAPVDAVLLKADRCRYYDGKIVPCSGFVVVRHPEAVHHRRVKKPKEADLPCETEEKKI